MRRDWFGAFLPFWACGTIVWMIGGFILMPEAFRRPLFVDRQEVLAAQIYDPTNIDPEIALKIGTILGLPMLLLAVTLTVAGLQQRRDRRLARQVQQ